MAQRVGRGIALLFHDRGTRRGWVVSSTPLAALYPRERPGTHFTGGWVGSGADLDGQKISLPSGVRYRTVQPVVSRYTDWTTRPTQLGVREVINKFTLNIDCPVCISLECLAVQLKEVRTLGTPANNRSVTQHNNIPEKSSKIKLIIMCNADYFSNPWCNLSGETPGRDQRQECLGNCK